MKNIIFDIDDTICTTVNGQYSKSQVNEDVVKGIIKYKALGFNIILSTSRNMRTYEGNVGKINVNTLPVLIEWLNKNNIPYDEIYMGKPWCGTEGFYVDDKAIRPDEFVKLSYEEIIDLTRVKK